MTQDDNVVILPVATRLDIPAERVLNGALDADLDRCFVIGRTRDGEFYFASTTSDGGTVIWDMEIAKSELLKIETG